MDEDDKGTMTIRGSKEARLSAGRRWTFDGKNNAESVRYGATLKEIVPSRRPLKLMCRSCGPGDHREEPETRN